MRYELVQTVAQTHTFILENPGENESERADSEMDAEGETDSEVDAEGETDDDIEGTPQIPAAPDSATPYENMMSYMLHSSDY
ncbi:hypothetical protein NM688_g4574 [Phlebia brevispora]|uniref:Uncharacterized protein n=1 Tax=Phlebia brevispora TaxID=194682 RepID=A0ACC1T2P5_9APHY|nr:hypothetical protein NM688_g4574 [Phlebia brevispora]